MAGENEPARLLLPYLQRADELQKHEPLVAYYCRLYGMERGLKIPQSARTKTTNALLISLMNQLEKDKKTVELGPDDNLHIEGFALNVFAKADKQDRAGRADLNTAKTFYAASLFFEVLNQFGAVPPDLEQKQKYAVWKAADIRKALKEGRKPVPGPPGGEEDLSVPSNDDYDLESRTSQAPDDLEQRRTDVSFQSIDPRSDPTMGHVMPTDFPAPPRHDPSRSDPTMGHMMPTDFPAPPRHDPSTRPSFEPDSASPHNLQHSSSFPPPHNLQHSPSFSTSHSLSHSPNIPPSNDYPSQTYQPPPTNAPENYSHLYHQQSYQNEAPQQHLPHQQYQPQEPPAYTLPNFQSYPSFSESSLPTAPTNYASYYQGADVSYSTQPPAPSAADYPSSNQHNVSAPPSAVVPEAASTVVKTYKYDSSYQPPPEKIAEAHKAARFAVGALAFDDVSIAVDFLQKSLELLTNPSSSSSSGH